jgi:hypothetical protein
MESISCHKPAASSTMAQLDRQVVDALRADKTPVVPAAFETDTGKPGSPHLSSPAVGVAERRI